jgi:hypothetical protein
MGVGKQYDSMGVRGSGCGALIQSKGKERNSGEMRLDIQ